MVSRDDVADLMTRVLILNDETRRREASGWLVVVIDTESEFQRGVTSAYGPFETPEEALMVAAEFDRDPLSGTHPQDGEPGWVHVVVPMFEYQQPKAKGDT